MKKILTPVFVLAISMVTPDRGTAAPCMVGAFVGDAMGNCGVLNPVTDPVGVVGASPAGGEYTYVSTSGGVLSAGQIPGVTDLLGFPNPVAATGSEFLTQAFSANAGDTLEFYFNYVTTDGLAPEQPLFPDYSFAELLTGALEHKAWLFTARTTPTGNTVPGFDLPGIDAVLTPPAAEISNVAPDWPPLGSYSEACSGIGCGYTGWIKSVFAIADAGEYRLKFGVTNWADNVFDSGLAFDGRLVAGAPPPSAVPEPGTSLLLSLGLGVLAAYLRFGKRKTSDASA